MTLEKMWEILIDCEIATDEEIQLVTSINGYNEETMLDILEVRTGLKTFEQLIEEYYL